MTDKNHPVTHLPAQTGITISPEATKIASVIQEDPGCNLKQARDRTGLGRCVFETALEEATQANAVHQVPHGRETLLFPGRLSFTSPLVTIPLGLGSGPSAR